MRKFHFIASNSAVSSIAPFPFFSEKDLERAVDINLNNRGMLSVGRSNSLLFIFFGGLLGVFSIIQSTSVQGAGCSAKDKDCDRACEEKEEIKNEACSTQRYIDDLISDNKKASIVGFDTELVKKYMNLLNKIIQRKTVDADEIWKVADSINRALYNAPKDGGEIDEFVDKVRELTDLLQKTSYTDRIHLNANLSKQIQKRLPRLLKHITELSIKNNINHQHQREDFYNELKLFSDRYLSTRRFIPGIGFSYSYIPTIQYSNVYKVDFSPYQTDISGGRDTLHSRAEFSDKGYPSVSLNAKVPFAIIQVLFPDYEENKSTVLPVNQRSVSGIEDDVFYRSNISSKLEINYDINVNFSFSELASLISDEKYFNSSVDMGIGVGMIGFEVEDKVMHDIRFQTSPSQSFNDMMSGESIEQSNSQDYRTFYWSAYYDFQIADEITAGISFKKYMNEADNGARFNVDGWATSIYINWYPSTGWKN